MLLSLVVDDEEDVRRLLGMMMGRLGFVAFEAADGREALEVMKRTPDISVILLDWRMPVMDGTAFLKEVKADPSWSKIPVMMLTGLNEMEDVAKALQLGVKEYLMKPVTQRTLRDKLTLMGVLP